MVKQEINYIANRKKKFLKMSLIWGAVVGFVFALGLVLTKTRGSYFTLVAALFVLPLAQNLTRFIAFNRFKDADAGFGELLEQMKGSYCIFHSAIIPDNTATVFFEHIIVTSKNIYFLSYESETIENHKGWLQNRLSAKGILPKQVHFIHIKQPNGIKNAAFKIEKDACYSSEVLEQNAATMQAMLM